ncbi:MAG: DUF4446 family protein [Parcubacteria group bacterium]|nr:DUF4446 family protein [Parcubacteria group bacterium]
MASLLAFFSPFLSQQFLAVAVAGILIALLVLLALAVRTEVRLHRLFRGSKAKDLEGVMHALEDRERQMVETLAQHEEILKNLDARQKKSIKEVGVVRYNPFRGTSGSNQSFATAFINEEGNGVVISGLYSRERVSVFAKPVAQLQSEYELSREEREALAHAKTR